MANSKILKKVVALLAAIVMLLCLAVSASAVTINTTTKYIAGDATGVEVTAHVSDVGDAAEVTYYATKNDTPVYIDQKETVSGTATFKFRTDISNLESNVKVGYTGSEENATEGEIPGFNVTINGSGSASGTLIPSDQGEGGTVVIEYVCPDGKTVSNVTATNGVITWSYDRGESLLTVVLKEVTADTQLDVTLKDYFGGDPQITFIDAAAMKVDTSRRSESLGALYGENPYGYNEGDKLITVLAQAEEAEEYGIIVSKTAINSVSEFGTGEMTRALFESRYSDSEDFVVYQAMAKGAKNVFAVQLIDNGLSSKLTIEENTQYYTAVYAINSDGDCLVVVNSETVSIAAGQ